MYHVNYSLCPSNYSFQISDSKAILQFGIVYADKAASATVKRISSNTFVAFFYVHLNFLVFLYETSVRKNKTIKMHTTWSLLFVSLRYWSSAPSPRRILAPHPGLSAVPTASSSTTTASILSSPTFVSGIYTTYILTLKYIFGYCRSKISCKQNTSSLHL
jgi:hypothetical protein